jgi:hypothetical protein
MNARSSVGRGRPPCQAIGFREPVAATVTQVTVPATARLELELRLCPVNRGEAEPGLEWRRLCCSKPACRGRRR